MTAQMSTNGTRCGVFLCQCGPKIAPHVDLPALEQMIREQLSPAFVETMPFPCMAPGMAEVKQAIRENELDRVLVAGCEPRIMLKKFQRDLRDLGLEAEQIEMVNLRDHVALVHAGQPPAELALKGSKLIAAEMAGLMATRRIDPQKVELKGPVMILGGGMATYSAALELVRAGIDTIISVLSEDPEDEIRMLHERYPGERHFHARLRKIMQEVHESPHIKTITRGEVERVMGNWGDYSVTFSAPPGQLPTTYKVGAIIAALDAEMLHQGPDFGHDGVRVLCHTELEEQIWVQGVPSHRLVFWVNDIETNRPWDQLSFRGAWNLARNIRLHNVKSQACILFNSRITVPLSTAERVQARELGIRLIQYDTNLRPTIQSGYITYNDIYDQIERELPWDQLVLSPLRDPGHESIRIAKVLGIYTYEGQFLEREPQMVRPDEVGLGEKLIAGSSRKPCELQETLRQGRRAARVLIHLAKKAQAGELYGARDACMVDPSLCTGCGLCKEICDCGAILPVEGPGGGTPRSVDPMVCTGGGTCAASCPHLARNVQTRPLARREARAGALAQSLADNEVMGYACSWGGAAAADHAGLQGIAYNPRFYFLRMRCIGELDPIIMGRAFLEGANGLLLLGCKPETCHHSYGLDHTWSRSLMLKKLLELSGLERERISLAHGDLNDPLQLSRTVDTFVSTIDRLGPINRNPKTQAKIQALYDTLHNARVRWVLGASLRRPWETSYPTDQRHAMDYDMTLTDVITEEYSRTRITNLLKQEGKVMKLEEVVEALEVDKKRAVACLKDLSSEGIISRIFKDRVPYYSML
jgi:heterodisulfide reductase subunit A2